MAVLLTGTTIAGNVALHAGNVSTYALPIGGGTLTGQLNLHAGLYEGSIVFGSESTWRTGIRQHDDADAELRIWAKNANGMIFIATGYDGEPASISRPTDGLAIQGNKLGIGNFSTADPSYKLHVKGDIYANGGWVRVSGSDGLYFESYGGGWRMTDSTWIRAYNDKNIYTGGSIEAGGSVRADSGVIDSNRRFVIPGGASTVNHPSGTGGAIRINLPTATYGSNTMMSMTVHVYEYSTGQSFTIRCGGYNYYTHDWYNVFAYLLNDSGKGGDVPVYFGNDGTRDVIWIGNPDWSWSYPNVFVTDFQAGHSQSESWKTGWSISFDTAARTNVSASRTAYRQIDTGTIGSQSVSYATTSGSTTGNAATATTLATARTLTIGATGKNFNGSANVSWTLAEIGAQAAGSYAAASHTHAISDVNGLQGALDGKSATNHNHTYDVNDAWLRDNGDNANVKLYGNARQMVFRTDGTAEYASGVGGYAFAWMYGGDAASNRRMLLASDGRLWTSYHGWMDEAFAPLSHTHTPSQVGLGNVSNTAQVTTTYNSSLNSDSRNSRGVTRLYRNDSDSDYSVQTYWTGSHWFIRGYSGDTFHAEARVGYADSAGSASSVAWTNVTNRPTTLSGFTNDVVARTSLSAASDFQFGGQDISQNSFTLSAATTDTDQFGRFYYSGTSGSFWSRYLPVDKSGKYRMRIRWKASASNTTYIAVILLDTNGSNISGAGTYWAYPWSGSGAPTSWTTSEYWYDGSSFPSNAAYVAFGISHTNYGGGSATYYVSQLEIERYNHQINGNVILHAGNYNSYSPTLTGGNASGTWGINITGSSASTTGNAATATALQNGRTLTIGATGKTFDGTGNVAWSLAEIGAQAAGSYVIANGTSAGDIDADWGQSFKTFDPIPTGTPPIASPNIRTINVGENFARRTQLAFNYATDQAWFRRRHDSTWGSWREFIHSGNIGDFALTSLPPHNHTSLTGVTSIEFAAQSSDSASITTTVVSQQTSLNFNVSDDNNQDGFFWNFTPSGASQYNVMYLRSASNNSGNLTVVGNITLAGIPTTTNQARTIDFTGFDKEGTTDFSDRAYIQHTVNTGGHAGSVLVLSSQNDADDGIAFLTNASSKLKHNSNNIATEPWVTSQGYLTSLPSHTHDDRYYTESEVNTLLAGKLDIGAKAADSELIDGVDSSRIVYGSGSSKISSHSNANDWRDSGFYENDGGGSNWPSATWYNSINVRHSNQGNYHGFQVAMSYYDNNLWFRSYQGSGTFQSWAYAISSQNIGSQSVNYANSAGSASSASTATTANRLERYGVIYGNDWNTYYQNNRLIAISAHNATGSNKPDTAYNYGSAISYYNAGEDHYQIYITENSVNSNGKDRKMYYRSGWNGSWGGWRSVVDVYNSVCYIDAAVTATGDFTAYSDARIKENVNTLEGALNKTLSLRGVSYNRTDIEDKSTKIGFIAQELLEVVPEVVTEDENGMYGVSYGNITALLVEAIKEQQKQIEELKLEIQKLKSI